MMSTLRFRLLAALLTLTPTVAVWAQTPPDLVRASLEDRADARVMVKVTRQFSVAATGQNIFDRSHAEYGGREAVMSTLIPRSGYLQLVWQWSK